MRFTKLLLALGLGVAICSHPAVAGTLSVTSLSTLLTEAAEKIGGDHVKVTALVKAGMDPHEYEPTPQDLKAASDSQLILASGKNIENYLGKLSQSTGGRAIVLKVGDSTPSLRLAAEDGHGTVEDPHWWHSVSNMKVAVKTIRDEFCQLDPADQADFSRRADAYLAQLDELSRWVRMTVATLPKDQRKLVTSHDAFQYFARDYGFKIYPIEGVTTEEEPTSQKIAALIDAIKAQHVKAVFFENIENPKVVSEITKETGAKVGGELYADGLGKGEEATYTGMMHYNVSAIVDALK